MTETHSASSLIGRALQECQKNDSAIDQVSCIADVYAKTMLDWAILLAAVGTLSMVTIELFKSLLMARRLYHNLAVWAWFRRCPEHRFALGCWLAEHPTHEDARRECLELSAGEFRDARGWYDQPSDQLFSQASLSQFCELSCRDISLGSGQGDVAKTWCGRTSARDHSI
jgi:hypothetical protein